MRLTKTVLLACATVMMAPAAEADCLRAVFFDLGDTLVANNGGIFELRPGAQETVDALQLAGIELGIITNTPTGWTREDLEAVLAQPEFLDEFDVVVLSSVAGVSKPNAAIYTLAHSQLPTPIPVAASAFVGETLSEIANAETNPTSGARAAGMVGIHLSSGPPSPLADFTVALTNLPGVVDVVVETCTVFVDGFESGTTGAWSTTIP